MRTINVTFEDSEMERIKIWKGTKETWREFVLAYVKLLEGGDGQ